MIINGHKIATPKDSLIIHMMNDYVRSQAKYAGLLWSNTAITSKSMDLCLLKIKMDTKRFIQMSPRMVKLYD